MYAHDFVGLCFVVVVLWVRSYDFPGADEVPGGFPSQMDGNAKSTPYYGVIML